MSKEDTMTETLVQELRTSTDPEWFRALMITAASRIEELEAALEKIAAIRNEDFGGDWDEINRARQIARAALSDKG